MIFLIIYYKNHLLIEINTRTKNKIYKMKDRSLDYILEIKMMLTMLKNIYNKIGRAHV